MDIPLTSKRLALREFSLNDLDAYLQITQDSKYQRFYSKEDCSPQKARELISAFIDQAKESPRKKYQFAIEELASHTFIGTCGLRLEEQKQASLGCGIAREYQTSGYALEALSLLIKFGFETLDLARIYAETIEDNLAAVKLCKKAGMQVEETLTNHRYFKGRWWNTLILAKNKKA